MTTKRPWALGGAALTLVSCLIAAGCTKQPEAAPPAAPTAAAAASTVPNAAASTASSAAKPKDAQAKPPSADVAAGDLVPTAGHAPASPASKPAASVPDAKTLGAAAQRALDKYRAVSDGKNADYIPALAQVDPKLFGIAIATAQGSVVEVGDARHDFAIESISKIFTLARVLEDVGAQTVEERIGVNQSGLPFNSVLAIELNKSKHPAMNPLVNAGAMTAVSWVKASSKDQRWDRIVGTMNAFAGRQLSVDAAVYRSESETFQHNQGIAYLLEDAKVMQGDPDEALDLYTRQCSVSVTARDLAVMGSTLANGGRQPVTGQRIMSEDNAARLLAVMGTTGLYETTGQWMYRVGVPAKSGVGGGIVAVVPGRFAVATFAPPLDEAGNSVRGQLAIAEIVRELDANLYERKDDSKSAEGFVDPP